MTQEDLQRYAESVAGAARALRDAASTAESAGCTVHLSFDTHDYPNAFLSVLCEATFENVPRTFWWRALLLNKPGPVDDIILREPE